MTGRLSEAYVDPRSHPDPAAVHPPPRSTPDVKDLVELHRFCRQGRLYDVERWIQAEGPLQLAEDAPRPRRHTASALEIALERQDHALVLLLLCNGYDLTIEPGSPLDDALRARRWDLLDLLLDWGADPHEVDLEDLFGTYDSQLFERFRAIGVDLTADHAMADALGYHTSNKPLFGFAKRYRATDSGIQSELNIALGHHADEGNEKGVHLCLWAGADPHAEAPCLRWMHLYEMEDDEGDRGLSAIHRACSNGHVVILERLGPDPSKDDFEDLYRCASTSAVIDVLARWALPEDVDAAVSAQLMRIGWGFDDSWRHMDALERLFEKGVRWTTSEKQTVSEVRRILLGVPDRRFVELMKLLATRDHCATETLTELARTPAMRTRMKKVGFIPLPSDDPKSHNQYRPTGSRDILAKCGVEPPKPKKVEPTVPSLVRIGPWRRNSQEVRLTREELFERVWSQPATEVAQQWGLSGRGLAKACGRLKIPMPPRGYWARLRAGQRVRRPRLAKLRPGEAEKVVVYVPGKSG
jgi:hypothetical protein